MYIYGRMELNSAIQNQLVTRYKYITYYILHITYYILPIDCLLIAYWSRARALFGPWVRVPGPYPLWLSI